MVGSKIGAWHGRHHLNLHNFAITNSLPRLQDMSYDDGLFFERMVAEYTRSPESIARLNQFLDKTAPRLRMPE